MRIVVIDGESLAGAAIVRYLRERSPHELFFTTAAPARNIGSLHLDLLHPGMTEYALSALRPDWIVNCSGIVDDEARLREHDAYRINGLLPQQLAMLADRWGGRLIQLSTDSVFSGARGLYEERHVPDGTSVYALTKKLGEVSRLPHLTIRASLIGPEADKSRVGLLSWFLRRTGRVRGFVHVPWNGITSLELAKFLLAAMERKQPPEGIVHLANEEIISKYELLQRLRLIFKKDDVEIEPYDAVTLDRTLRCTQDLGYRLPPYEAMLLELRSWIRADADGAELEAEPDIKALP